MDSECALLRQIKELFQCVEVLRESPGNPPYCTKHCIRLISDILATEYGSDLLSCNCLRVKEENVPKINYLCEPFQRNAVEKCVFPTTSPPGK